MKSKEDFELMAAICEAKFDLTPFIEDGDRADEEILANNRESERLRKELHISRTRNPIHPLVRLKEKADAMTKLVRLALDEDDEGESKELHG